MTRDLFDPDYLRALQPKITGKSDIHRFQVAVKDWQNAGTALQESSSSANRKNLREAEEYLQLVVGELAARYDQGDPLPGPPTVDHWQTFTATKNRLEVYRFLSATGWDLSRSTFYRHVEDGKLRKNSDGLYTARAVKKYAETWAVRNSGQTVAEEQEDLAAAKTRAEILRINTVQARDAFRLDIDRGKYLPRADIELQMAGRAVALEAGYDHMIYTKAAEWVALVGGSQEKTELLIAALLAAKDEWLKSYADGDEFDITFEVGNAA